MVLQAAQVAGLDVGDARAQLNVVKELKRLVHKKPVLVQTHLVTFHQSHLSYHGLIKHMLTVLQKL